MSAHEDDVAARGASIFERLRAETAATAEETSADETTAEAAPGAEEPGQDESSAEGEAVQDRAPDDLIGAPGEASPYEASPHEASPHEAPSAPAAGEEDTHDAGGYGEASRSAPMEVAGVDDGAGAASAVDGDAAGERSAPSPEPGELSPAAPSPFARSLPRVLAIANQKGGVGKTTTAVNMGAALAELGYRTLIIDLDPQGNATTGLGINGRSLDVSVYDVILRETPIEDCIEPTSLKNLFVVPATIDLAGAEIELVPVLSRELRLRRALERVQADFDFAIIDCPPSLGLLTINGLAAATEVVVPIQCEYYALEGLGQLLRNVNLVQGSLNPSLEVSAIVLTMYDGRTKLADQVALDVREHFGDKVCRNVVPRTVRLSEAPSYGQPIILFDPSSRGALAYRELAKEVSGGAPQRAG